MNKKDFQKTMREADKKAMGMELKDFKKAVLRRIGAIEGEMFYVRQLVGTNYEAVKSRKALISRLRKDLIRDRAAFEKDKAMMERMTIAGRQ
ncbi:MAG TPA: hypothetical protein PK022_09375 [Syntrophales bacterium]|nr:hypothetical protein [Syntrophales bacterium]